MCQISMMRLLLHTLLLTTTAKEIVSYQRYRVDCEQLCHNIQQFSGLCPTYGSCQWYCQEKQANCPTGTRYHCARDLNVEEAFVVACTQETFCRSGEEPRISLDTASSHLKLPMGSVFCRPCFKRERFNSLYNTLSATFSECHSVKTNLCTAQAYKIDCGSVLYRELTKTDGYCRCDARKGYASQSEEMCFYENNRCFKTNCPDGEELLLNYSCAEKCPAGLARPETSDNCLQNITFPPETTSFLTTVIEDKATDLSTENPYKPQILSTNIYWAIVIAAISITGAIMLVEVCKYIQGRQSSLLDPQERSDSPECVPLQPESATQVLVIGRSNEHMDSSQESIGVNPEESNDATSLAVTTTDETQDSQVEAEKTAAKIEPSESTRPTYFGQVWCEKVYANLCGKNNFNYESCLKLISDECCYEYDDLQNCEVTEPSSCLTLHALDAPGFAAYKIPGEETTNVYVLISHLLCGNGDLKDALRFAAAHVAIDNFEKYVKQLMEEFIKSKTPLIAAWVFFEVHGIHLKEFELPLKEENISLALENLVHELVVSGIPGPFHAELLSGVLNCNIIQHFENNRYHDRDVDTTPGLRLSLKSSSSRDRELHLYWLKSASNPHSYCIMPLFKVDDDTYAKMDVAYQVPKLDMDMAILDNIIEMEPYTWRNIFKIFGDRLSVIFDDLKEMRFIKPDSIIRTIDVPGYKAYEKPGEKNTSVYEWINILLFGNQSLMYVFRLAAARYAMKHFETYVTKLTDEFINNENPFLAANVFFKANGIDIDVTQKWPTNARNDVAVAFERLVRETVNEKKGNAPFYLEFLSGVLNRKITLHCEKNFFDGRKVETIAGLNVTLTTETSSERELHVYCMKSSGDGPEKFWIVPLFKCVPTNSGMQLCEDIYNQEVFVAQISLDMIHKKCIYEFEQLKWHVILKPDPHVMRIIKTINVPGYTAYEKSGHETTCPYEFMSYLLFGNAEMKYILRLAAIRYALQNFDKYVVKLADAFETWLSRSQVNARLFFEMHGIEFKESKQSSVAKDVGMVFADLVRETVNTGQGPFYMEFLCGALNCKITQHFEEDRYYDQDVRTIRGLNVSLTTITPPERELHIYWMKTSNSRCYLQTIVPLLKNDNNRRVLLTE